MGEHGHQRAVVAAGLLLGLAGGTRRSVRRGGSRVLGLLAVARLLGLAVLGLLAVSGLSVTRLGPGGLSVGGLAAGELLPVLLLPVAGLWGLGLLRLPVPGLLLVVPGLFGATGRSETGRLLSVGGLAADLLSLVGLGCVR
ncbi:MULTISPECIES: hypothetical protein [Nocardiopsis]|uniref:Uncharacterized protein n=1 Tax=Nocardiopsis sinuspersici TaxID=501010 RepID=A0A1V3BX89_9ACTN|nr:MULTISPECIES: hypothetical protein [Nocardiopsis]OOC52992.1 hypothetical protein NOSIN_03450 [Nocardiopsis sinuspersici]